MMMRLIRFIVVSVLLFNAIKLYACWWEPSHAGNVMMYRIMPLDESDYHCYETTWESDYMLHEQVDYKQDNICLWQQQTSTSINKRDIEKTVYSTNLSGLDSIIKNEKLGINNTFIKWIRRHNRADILQYLYLAKQVEMIRASMEDPWYYRVEDSYHYKVLYDIEAKCRQYQSGPLLERYALQMTRVLCALRKYSECVKYWNDTKDKIPHNAIREMTELMAASALNKTGNKEDALIIYAKYGDVSSIRIINDGRIDNELELVYNLHPNSPYLEGEIQKWLLCFGGDWVEKSINEGRFDWYEPRMNNLLKVAHRAVKEKKTKKIAMWYYTLAALYDTKGEPRKAKKYLELGSLYPKSKYLKDSYRVLHMWLDAKTATYNQEYEQRLFNDLMWLNKKIRNEVTPEVYEILKNKVVEGDWVYYECYRNGYLDRANMFYWNDAMRRILLREVCPRMHKAGKYVREIQLSNMADNLLGHYNIYSNEMFQIMDRLSYKDTRDYFARIYHPQDEFDVFLNNRGMTDKLYWYDILATKCMREQRYSKAIVYLRQIPLRFQKQMNVFDCMNKDPFSYDMQTFKDDSLFAPNYKLHFAERMAEYRRIMKWHRDPNKRAEAKIQYALGLRNSVHRCWFLTRHSSNAENDGLIYDRPEISYPEDSTIYRHAEYMEMSDKLINEALNSFTDTELAARESRKLLRYQRIIDHYVDTETAVDIMEHCDKWKDYAETKMKNRKVLSLN